jgi:uncharacterized alpha-E superfamily protein
MWETINGAWLELRKVEPASLGREELARFLEWVKNVSLTFDGSAYRTMLRNDAYWFTRLGACIERADNTARILDVKYHVLLPETEDVGGSLDYFQWATILRGVSALTSYHWVYRQSVKPWLVADLLILNRQMPRSLISSYETIVRFLDALGEAYGKVGQPHRIARNTLNALDTTVIDDVFQQGLHEFVTGFITDNNRLGKAIADHYLT